MSYSNNNDISEKQWAVILFKFLMEKERNEISDFGPGFTFTSPDKINKYFIQNIATTLTLVEMFLINIFNLKHKV